MKLDTEVDVIIYSILSKCTGFFSLEKWVIRKNKNIWRLRNYDIDAYKDKLKLRLECGQLAYKLSYLCREYEGYTKIIYGGKEIFNWDLDIGDDYSIEDSDNILRVLGRVSWHRVELVLILPKLELIGKFSNTTSEKGSVVDFSISINQNEY